MTLCSRSAAKVHPDELRRVAADVTDWSAVAELATRHRVVAYTRDAIARAGLTLPEAVARALQAAELVALAAVMGMNAELTRLLSEFHDAGVEAIVLKGPGLARTIYPEARLRPYGDIDLTVQKHRERIAADILLAHGYTELTYEAEHARQALAGHLHGGAEFHRQFEKANGGVLIELHTDPLQLGLRPTCETERWNRAVPVPGLPHGRMLCPEDQIVQLSAHVHKHGFDRLIWLKDLELLVDAHHGDLDWDLVARVARDEGVHASVWYSLSLTRDLLAATIPDAVLRRVRPSPPLRLLYARLWPHDRIANLEGFMRRRAVQMHAAESWRGFLPSLVLMGRRRDRGHLAWQLLQDLRVGHREPMPS